MKCDQRAMRFDCLGSSMVGIIDLPQRPLPRGVLMMASQRHSRLGAQRQYAMLARALARRGLAVMRFDRRGVGDSEGCDYNDSDMRSAVDEFCAQVPQLREVVLLSPASGDVIASASACARGDVRVRALVLLDARRQGRGRVARLADQFSGFPGRVMLLATSAPTLELDALRKRLAGGGAGAERIEIIENRAPPMALHEAGDRAEAEGWRAATCASWIVSW